MTQIDPTSASAKANTIHNAALPIAQAICSGVTIKRLLLNEAMTAAFGTSNASGAWSQRDSFEMLEHATVLSLLNTQADNINWSIDTIKALSNRLPTQTVRSEAQVSFQQFSTPLEIAWFVGQAAALSPDDIVLEPSAGTGLLALAGQMAGARLILNELNPLRHQLLSHSFQSATLFNCDGAHFDAQLTAQRPSVVLMNPPFSKRAGGSDDHFAAFRHLQAALRALRPNGRLVAVMPDWFSPSGKNEHAYRACVEEVSLVGNFRVDPGGFAKHGTSVAVRIIVIDKIIGTSVRTCINRTSVDALIPFLETLPPRREMIASHCLLAAPTLSKSSMTSVFAGFAKPAALLRPKALPAKTNPTRALIAYTPLETPAPTQAQVGVYLPYRPSRIVFDAAGDHPTPLVESIAMGSIASPIPTYVPLLVDFR